MDTLDQRVVAAARGWVGTRFHHQGRLKKTDRHGGGVDCLGLLAGVAAELELRTQDGLPLAGFDRADYGHVPDGAALRAGLSALLSEIPVGGMLPGDIVLMALDGTPRHLGIISDLNGMPGLIHAYAQARKVVEHPLDGWWRERIVAVFRLPII